ncbi:NUDIX domain-containing protein [[Mycoplasma] falconis]|uniref:Bis(5'-nucleosyl)-tetraphosphatase [asymmetrical] n=1 Tax=[Mycoplasma] falconis TaxID=92403 RepID=A0A501X9M2_9BACT|nr:NUDIX domain-containing protein [[Mycoplasma] falconis]TPE57220.1 NUDIX domain-containing protein [[Mycoplasma] falconis]
MIREQSCGALVFRYVNDKLCVLIVEQRAGHWGFPKGHTEKGETQQMTAIREVKEETNIDIKIIDGFKRTNEYSPFFKAWKKVHYFIGIPKTFELIKQDEEINVVTWEPIVDAKLYRLSYDNDIKILDEAINYITENNLFHLFK